jgi:hypothetical protein
MDQACGMPGKEEKCTQNVDSKNLMERDQLGDLGTHVKLTVKCMLQKKCDGVDLSSSGYDQWWGLLKVVMDLQVPLRTVTFLTSQVATSFSRTQAG